ncbi:MAG: uroporphyrinogen decarboxylase family protein [Candidatus Geothermincolia bacterium]
MAASHDRVLAALELREPDRVPTMDMMVEYANIMEILGKKPIPLGLLFRNPYAAKVIDFFASHAFTTLPADMAMDMFAYDRTAASVKMGYDSAWVQHNPVWKSGDSKKMVDSFGRLWTLTFDDKGLMLTPMYTGGLIESPDDWRALEKRDLFKLPAKNNKTYAKIQKAFGEELFIFGSFSGGLYEVTWQSMGFERFVVNTRKERAFLERMITFYTDLYCEILEAMADAGLPGAVYSDDLAYRSGPMLSPKLLESLFGDGYRRLTRTAHNLGMKIVIHSCGNVYDLLPWFADCGFDGVHALEPTAGVELKKAKEIIGDRLCLLGNVDVTHILVDADKEEVFEAIRQSIQDAAAGGGYILAPTNSHPGMSVQRLRWMLEAVKKYG